MDQISREGQKREGINLILCAEQSLEEALADDSSAEALLPSQPTDDLRRIRYPSCQDGWESLFGGENTRALNNSLRKYWALIIEKVGLSLDGGTSLEQLSTLLQRKPNNLAPVLAEIVESGLLLEVTPEVYALPEDFEDRLKMRLENSGHNIREEEQRKRYSEHRNDFTNSFLTSAHYYLDEDHL